MPGAGVHERELRPRVLDALLELTGVGAKIRRRREIEISFRVANFWLSRVPWPQFLICVAGASCFDV
jgi:hypothetical protein